MEGAFFSKKYLGKMAIEVSIATNQGRILTYQ